MVINVYELEKLYKEIIGIGSFQYAFSLHTLTFNITENFTKEVIQELIKKYTSKINKIYLNSEFDIVYYIYTYEVSKEYHIHVHLILNKQCNDKEKKELIEY
jgi:hypothetical protein